jgi:hypothetical protein
VDLILSFLGLGNELMFCAHFVSNPPASTISTALAIQVCSLTLLHCHGTSTIMRCSVLLSALLTCINETGAFVVPHIQRTPSSFGLFAKKAAASSPAEDIPPENKAKKAALDGVLQQIERSYGRGSIVKLGDAKNMVVDCIGSGSLTLGES